MVLLTTLPHEVLHNILRRVDPLGLSSLSGCCTTLHRFISDNRPLFKDVYLQRLDNPPQRLSSVDFAWEEGLRNLVKLQRILESVSYDAIDKKVQQMKFVAQTVTGLLRTASPAQPSRNVELLSRLFDGRKNQEAFFCQSSLFQRAKVLNGPSPMIDLEDRQLSAKLHCLYGVPITSPRRTVYASAYPYACSVVYDLRRYTDYTMWGPFLDDGMATVDWEKMEAIMIVLGYNLRIFSHSTNGIFKPIWATPFAGAIPDSFAAVSLLRLPEPAPPLDAGDPYNVSGTWMRVVCFLDYNELFSYNFASEQPPVGEPRPPIQTTEAIRLIVMEIRTTKIEPPGEDDGQDLPIVHFRGTSRAMHMSLDPNANSNIRGTVRLTKEGEVRWTTFSIYGGEERWKSEGIQVGGLCSARGVIGNWFDKDFDIHGPAGPTAFWKISNEIDEAVHNHEVDDDDDDDDDGYEDDEELVTILGL